VIWPYAFSVRGFREGLAFATALHEGSGGRRVAQKLRAGGELLVRGTVAFPNAGGSYASFRAFWEARSGPYEPFLYRAQNPGAAAMADAFTATTGQTDFDATRRYVITAGLQVRKAGVLQTETTHYTLRNESGGAYVLGTSTKLVVHFLAAPGNGVAVTLAYEFYYPVRLEGDEPPEEDIDGGGRGAAATADRKVMVGMRETGAGFSYAAAPNVL
jgi:hypothetical protein